MARLRIETLLAIDELPDGSCLAYPVVDPRHVALGREEDAIAEVRLFLADELTNAHPATIARYAIPPDAEPYATEIVLPELELPERLRRKRNATLHAVVLPHADGRWVLVPALRHTIYVAKNEELSETVRHELQRHLDAMAPSIWPRVQLLPPVGHRLERVAVLLDRPDPRAGGTRKLRDDLERARRRKHATEVLGSIATPMHTDPRVMEGPPMVGRDAEVKALDALLGSDKRHAVLLVGAERVGKSAILHRWLRENEGRRVYQTSGAQLIAGMSGLGQWQERVRRVVDAVETLDAVLYFDDLRDLFDRTSGKGSVDIPGAMKPALEEGRIRILGELDEENADLLASQNEGFFQSFHTIRVPPTDRRHAGAVLTARSERVGPEVRVDARDAILALCERYLPYRPFPGKAAELFDQLVATAERPGVALDAADELRASDVYRLFSLQTGIPEFLLREDRALDPDRLRERFRARLVGQRPAVDAVADTLCVVKAGLQPTDKPLATFLFVGPTGVGKTELARALAEVLYGSEERLVRFDMSEYGDGLASQRLISGGDGDGLLTRAVREQPFAVVLLDEIEKAHPAVFDLLLQVTGEGRLTDARGKTAFFHNTILIMTSNIGASHRLTGAGFGARDGTPDLAAHYTRETQRWFRPEFVNRLDRIIPFAPLDREAIRRVTEMSVDRFGRRRGIADRGVTLTVSDAALETLARDGFDEAYGARALRRHLENALAGPVSTVIAGLGGRAQGMHLLVRTEAESAPSDPLARHGRGGLVVEALPSESGAAREDYDSLAATIKLRREIDSLMRLPSVEVHRDEMNTLLAQLSAPRSKKAQKRAGVEIARMQQDHHRLDERWRALTAARDEAYDLEELAFTGFFDREAYPSALEDTKTLRHTFRMELLQLLFETDPRHQITILCEELDAGRTLDVWLASLLKDLDRRGWEAVGHVFKDPTPAVDWPPSASRSPKAYGPPRRPEALAAYLERPERDRAVVLLRVRGPHAGTHLAVECGLHRHFGVEPLPTGSHHSVRMIATRFDVREHEWGHPSLEPMRPPPPARALKQPSIRWTDVRPGQTLPESYVDIPLEAYWSAVNADELALRDLINIDRTPNRDRESLFVSPLDVDEDEG